jgi:PAS domain S-box-containing protein
MDAEDPALFARLLEQMADAVIYADAAGRIAVWNAAASALFGFSTAEAVGQSLDIIVPEHLQPRHWHGFNAAIASGAMSLQGRPTLTRAKHRNGQRLYVEMTFALVRGGDGRVVGAVAVARDATDRVRQQRDAAPT